MSMTFFREENQSEHINELITALSKAQGEMGHSSKDSFNPHFKTKYSDLASVCRACKEPLTKYGLAVSQILGVVGEKQVLITILGHSSGQWLKSVALLPIQKPGPQETVSCIKYMRRASLAAITGVYEDDDDGEAAQSTYREPAKTSSTQPLPAIPRLTETQCAMLDVFLMEFPESRENLCQKYSIVNIYDLKQSDWGFVVDVFNQKKKNREKTA